jgi:hypothetical protein
MSRKATRKSAHAPDAVGGEEAAVHIHRPKAPHGARELAIEIGVIVVGIVIAIGLEQTVEALHHQSQRSELEQQLRTDIRLNRDFITGDLAAAHSVVAWATDQAEAVARAGASGPLRMRRMPNAKLLRPDAGVWPAAKANGRANLLPTGEQNWFEDLNQAEGYTFITDASASARLEDAYAALNLALAGHVREAPSGELDISTLDAKQRAAVVERLGVVAQSARLASRDLVSVLNDMDYILATSKDRLDDPKAMRKFDDIARRNAAAAPDMRYSFSPK